MSGSIAPRTMARFGRGWPGQCSEFAVGTMTSFPLPPWPRASGSVVPTLIQYWATSADRSTSNSRSGHAMLRASARLQRRPDDVHHVGAQWHTAIAAQHSDWMFSRLLRAKVAGRVAQRQPSTCAFVAGGGNSVTGCLCGFGHDRKEGIGIPLPFPPSPISECLSGVGPSRGPRRNCRSATSG
jgi:hypothetical protein